MTSTVEISHRTIIFTVLFLLALWFLFSIKDILFFLFISLILMSALRPLVDALGRLKIPRIIAIISIYAVVFGFLGITFAGVVPSLATQTVHFVQQLPFLIAHIVPSLEIDMRAISQQLAPIGENVVKATIDIFSNVFQTLTILVFTFYLLLEHKHLENLFTNFMGEEAGIQTLRIVDDIEKKLGMWVQGQLILMAVIGVFAYIGLLILKVDFALPLAILAGLMEVVPIVGPIISGIPAVFVGLSVSPLLGLSVVALYFIIHQLENNLVVPFVMKKSVGLSPIITFLALMIGAKFGGITGVILSVPSVLVLQTFFRLYFESSVRKKSLKIPE